MTSQFLSGPGALRESVTGKPNDNVPGSEGSVDGAHVMVEDEMVAESGEQKIRAHGYLGGSQQTEKLSGDPGGLATMLMALPSSQYRCWCCAVGG